MAVYKGYQCEFIDSVFEDLYCKKCGFVARRLSITTCCTEGFCQQCIAAIREEGQPCPACGKEDYNILDFVKNQKRISCLHAYCSMKERGCGWSGTLEQLDTHLDPDKDNCQYVDTKCPLNCHMAIPKNKVEQHVAQYCAKRPYVCQHCNFKATYEEVVDKHLAECKYVPLQCPNHCGVTFERDFLEDHMKICRLQEVGCEFTGVGCEDRFIREDQEEHTRQNSHKHLTLTASVAMGTRERLQQKLEEQKKKHKEEEEKLKNIIKELEEKIKHQETKLELQEVNLKNSMEKILLEANKQLNEVEGRLMSVIDKQEQKVQEKMKDQLQLKLLEQEKKYKEEAEKLKRKIDEQEKKMDNQEKKMKKQKEFLEKQLQELKDVLLKVTTKSDQNKVDISSLASMTVLNRRTTLDNFSAKKTAREIWRSPSLYTHLCGHKFCIEVHPSGYREGLGKTVLVGIRTMSGEYDDALKWPSKYKITLQLANQCGGEDIRETTTFIMKKTSREYFEFYGLNKCKPNGMFDHTEVNNYLKNDTLYFFIPELIPV